MSYYFSGGAAKDMWKSAKGGRTSCMGCAKVLHLVQDANAHRIGAQGAEPRTENSKLLSPMIDNPIKY